MLGRWVHLLAIVKINFSINSFCTKLIKCTYMPAHAYYHLIISHFESEHCERIHLTSLYHTICNVDMLCAK